MRNLITLVAGFVVFAAAVLAAFQVVLWPPGAPARLALIAAVAAVSALLLAAVRKRLSGSAALAATVASGAVALLAGWAVWQNEKPANTDWEGYVSLVGFAAVAQGVLAAIWFVRSRQASAASARIEGPSAAAPR